MCGAPINFYALDSICRRGGASDSRLLSFFITFGFSHFRFQSLSVSATFGFRHFRFTRPHSYQSINSWRSFYCVAQRHTMGYVWETLIYYCSCKAYTLPCVLLMWLQSNYTLLLSITVMVYLCENRICVRMLLQI